MVACGGVSLRVAAQMAYVHRRKFAAAWQELTGPRPAIDAVPEPAVMPDPQPAAAMPEKEFEQVLAGNIGGRSHAR